jgi:hypothetical protein
MRALWDHLIDSAVALDHGDDPELSAVRGRESQHHALGRQHLLGGGELHRAQADGAGRRVDACDEHQDGQRERKPTHCHLLAALGGSGRTTW